MAVHKSAAQAAGFEEAPDSMKAPAMIAAGWLLLLSLSGCTFVPLGGESGTESSAPTSAAAQTTEKTEPPTTKAPEMAENPLTGVKDMEKGISTRPVGIMLGNDSRSRPQCGIDRADWYFEAETEGGITRIMAVFASTARVPDKLGPVRSARTPFVLLAQSLDLIYAHAGGSKAALAALGERDLADVNALRYDGSLFWRDKALRSERGYEYSLVTSGKNLTAIAKQQNFRTSSKAGLPFRYDRGLTSGSAATELQCRVSRGQTVNFKYYPDEGLYYKRNGTLSNPKTHASLSGVQLSAANVVVLFDRRYAENKTTIGFDLTEGDGKLFTGGRMRDIRWKRTADALRLYETDGTDAGVARGKTYFLLVDRDLRSDTFGRG